jgi:hypothetical protein
VLVFVLLQKKLMSYLQSVRDPEDTAMMQPKGRGIKKSM